MSRDAAVTPSSQGMVRGGKGGSGLTHPPGCLLCLSSYLSYNGFAEEMGCFYRFTADVIALLLSNDASHRITG